MRELSLGNPADIETDVGPVIDADAVIDEKALALDEMAIEILARQQPVARDLRIVVSALRMSASVNWNRGASSVFFSTQGASACRSGFS